jgi:hypothetical protein
VVYRTAIAAGEVEFVDHPVIWAIFDITGGKPPAAGIAFLWRAAYISFVGLPDYGDKRLTE